MAAGYLGTIWASIALDAAPLGAGTARARRLIYGLDATVHGRAATMGTALMGIAKPVTILGGVVAATSVKMAADFDNNVRKVWSLTTESEEKFKSWKKELLTMSTELPQSANDLADAMYWVRSAMPDASDAAVFDVLTVAAKGAVAGFTNVGPVADAITSALAAYGNEALTASQYMDIMLKSVERGKLTLEDWNSNIGKVVGSSALAGVEFHELAAAVSTLTRVGVPADTTFMALNQLLMTFIKPSSQAKKAAEELGIEFSLSALRADGLGPSLIKVMDAVEGADERIAELFPNIRALRAVLPLTGLAADEFANDIVQVGGAAGTTSRMFEVATDSISARFKIMGDSIRKTMIELGEKLFPAAESAVGAVTNAFQGNNAAVNTVVGAFRTAGGVLGKLIKLIWDARAALIALGAAFLAFKVAAGLHAAVVGIAAIGKSLLALGGIIKAGGIVAGLKAIAPAAATAGAALASALAVPATIITTAAAAIAAPLIVGAVDYRAQASALGKYNDAVDRVRESERLAGEALSPLVSQYTDLRNQLPGLTEGSEEYNATIKQMNSLAQQIIPLAPALFEGFDEYNNVLMKSNEELLKHVNLMMGAAGSLRAEGQVGELDRMVQVLEAHKGAQSDMGSQVATVEQLLQKYAMSTEQAATMTRHLQRDTDGGAEAIRAFADAANLVGRQDIRELLEAEGISNFNDALAYVNKDMGALEDALKEIERVSGETGMSFAELTADIVAANAEIARFEQALLQAANVAGATGQEIPASIVSALESGIPEIHQRGRDALAQYALGMLRAAGAEESTIVATAQGVANAFVEGGAGTGDDFGDMILEEIRAKFGDTDSIEAAAAAVGKKAGEATVNAYVGALSGLYDRVSRMLLGLVLPPIFVDVLPRFKVNPTFSSPYEAGQYMVSELGRGIASQPVTATLYVPGTEHAMQSLEGAFGAFRREMEGMPFKEVEDALMAITGQIEEGVYTNWEHLKVWRAVREQMDSSTSALEAHTNRLSDAEKAVEKLTERQSKLNEELGNHRNELSRLQGMKLTGETAADEKSFQMGQRLNEIQLQILRAREDQNYELVAQLNLQKRELERQKEIHDLQAEVDYAPQRRELEQVLDLEHGREMSLKDLLKAIKDEQRAIKEKERLLGAVENRLKEQQKYVKDMREEIEFATKTVDKLKTQVDEMARHFLDRFREMERAAKDVGTAVGEVGAGGYPSVGGSAFTMVNEIHAHTHLDGKEISHTVSRQIARNGLQHARSGARYN